MTGVATPEAAARLRLRVTGLVQGVGFRPYVHRLASELGLAGHVGNDTAGVFIEVEGLGPVIDEFMARLVTDAPGPARITGVVDEHIAPTGDTGFVIVESQAQGAVRTFVSPDIATCADCLAELFDPADRRCTLPVHQLHQLRAPLHDHAVPALRPAQHDHGGLRPVRGLRVGVPRPGRPALPRPARCLCRLRTAPVVRAHRHRRRGWRAPTRRSAPPRPHWPAGRSSPSRGSAAITSPATPPPLRPSNGCATASTAFDKPFAVMVRDLEAAAALAHIDQAEADLLASAERPIVLVRRRDGAAVSALVAPANPRLGVLLPYTPLHHLLFAPVPGAGAGARVPAALVMTSGNLTDEPICFEDADARRRLGGIADAWLLHDRPIHVPCDDSVLEVDPGTGHVLPLRRSRGYAPLPVRLPFAAEPTLAVGGELKNTFCLASGHDAFMSQHIGDMGSLETWAAFERSARQLAGLYGIAASQVAADAHPGYQTRRWADEAAPGPVAEVYHHHAHIASVMAEHGVPAGRRVIGLAFDGTGFGTDGTIWGGEVLVAGYDDFARVGHLRPVPLPGGDAAIRRPCRAALAHLWAAGIEWAEDLPPVAALGPDERAGPGPPARTRHRMRADLEHGATVRRRELAARPAPPTRPTRRRRPWSSNGRPRRPSGAPNRLPRTASNWTAARSTPRRSCARLVADVRARRRHRGHGGRLPRRGGPARRGRGGAPAGAHRHPRRGPERRRLPERAAARPGAP